MFFQVLAPLSPDDLLGLDGEAGNCESICEVGLNQVGDDVAEWLVDGGGLRSVDGQSHQLLGQS